MKNTIFIILLFVVVACNPDRIFYEYQSIDESLWYKTDVKEFDVNIQEKGTYSIELALRYIEGCPHKRLPIKIDYISPSGESFSLTHDFILQNENGEYQGEIAGNICDLGNQLNDNIEFNETGTFKFYISQELDRDPAMLIMEIGLLIERVTSK